MPQIFQKFEDIKKKSFDVKNKNFKKEQKLRNSHIIQKEKKFEEEQKNMISIIEKQINDKYYHLIKMASTVNILKVNQERTALKLGSVSSALNEFKHNTKQTFKNNYDKSINDLETQLKKLQMGISMSKFSSKDISPKQSRGGKGRI